MPVRVVLLRLLLCVALVFNGAASAMASVQAMQMHAQMDAAAVPAHAHADAMAASAMPCHHGEQAQHGPPAESGEPAKNGHPAAPDCCESNTCACACVTPVVAMVPTPAFRGIPLADAGHVRPMALGHPAPALPHPIRPPIG